MNATAESHDPSPVARFHFKTKILVTALAALVCVSVVLKLANDRHAVAVQNRHNELVQVLTANIISPPKNTINKTHVGEAEKVARLLSFGSGDDPSSQLPRKGPARVTDQEFLLDVSNTLEQKDKRKLSEHLIKHYTKGLDRLGMRQRHVIYRVGLDERWSRCVWASLDYDLSVVIDVDIPPDGNRAEVRFLVIDGQ
jgi:hypothetical protein